MCSETAEHFREPRVEFARFDALLRPGGVLGVMTGMLEVLCNRRLSTDGYVHTLRCKGFGQLASKIGDKSLFVPFAVILSKQNAWCKICRETLAC